MSRGPEHVGTGRCTNFIKVIIINNEQDCDKIFKITGKQRLMHIYPLKLQEFYHQANDASTLRRLSHDAQIMTRVDA